MILQQLITRSTPSSNQCPHRCVFAVLLMCCLLLLRGAVHAAPQQWHTQTRMLVPRTTGNHNTQPSASSDTLTARLMAGSWVRQPDCSHPVVRCPSNRPTHRRHTNGSPCEQPSWVTKYGVISTYPCAGHDPSTEAHSIPGLRSPPALSAGLLLPAAPAEAALVPGQHSSLVHPSDSTALFALGLAVVLLMAGRLQERQPGEGLLAFLTRVWTQAQGLEVRLDVTTLWCLVLAAKLFSIPEQGYRLSLGFDAANLRDLGQLIVSGSVLSVFWVAMGLLAGEFDRTRENLRDFMVPTLPTAVVAGCAWQLVDTYMVYGSLAEGVVPPIHWLVSGLRVACLAAGMTLYRYYSFYNP